MTTDTTVVALLCLVAGWIGFQIKGTLDDATIRAKDATIEQLTAEVERR